MENKLFALSDVYRKEKVKLDENDNIELLLGGIMLNRIVGIAYDNLDLDTVPKEVIKVLKIVKQHNERSTDDFINNVCYVADILNGATFKYALLKGSFLTTKLYKRGLRTSNDIDILVEGKDVSALEKILLQNGFIQGYLNENNEIIPASRREILHSRLNNGETVPFIKLIDGKKLEIDINFSVDYKADGARIVPQLLTDLHKVELNGHTFTTLNPVDFLIHLCCHLYKEATTYDWIINRRDLMLYKFSDINVMLTDFKDNKYYEDLIARIREFELEKECYYVFCNSCIIYPELKHSTAIDMVLDTIKPEDLRYMRQIIHPSEKRILSYDTNFTEWFDCSNRIIALN